MLERALQLVLAVYRVTALFPEGEVLIGQIRQTANQVLAELVFEHPKKSVKQIRVLLRYFQIAQAQNWTKPINFAILTREYQRLLDEIRLTRKQSKTSLIPKIGQSDELNYRQKKILAYLKKQEPLKLKDLIALFPKVTSRTVQNDLSEMTNRKILILRKKGRSSFYEINREITK